MTTELAQAPVLFEELACADGSKLGVATLNLPKALNSLNVVMVELLLAKLHEWKSQSDIGAVLLKGAGEKAFCAGGDVVALYNAMKDQPGQIPELAQNFFREEYKLDYFIHDFGKPFIVWGCGIVMGGGMGLLMGASHRIVTETSRMAMPEITIGLYPDVGGSYFLNKMPAGCGMFSGLTGASINGADSIVLGLADYFNSSENLSEFTEQLQAIAWNDANAVSKLDELCIANTQANEALKPVAQFQLHIEAMQGLAQCSDLQSSIDYILAMPSENDKWLSKAQANLKAGSPITMHLVYEQLNRAGELSLAECFQMELAMSYRCASLGEFQEGVRALLIDKDMQPKWQYATPAEVPADLVESFFEPQWEGEHPLQALTN
ncbi:enoyl-CoA hydratase/isomerase family protein [Paraneptunicella aestuarii]|uniref:enoyl-CoA hydratase/isomerase family protein n=1 Tax=Paraneptunicella aestuarii TaxID=2831148 RepID=UPI001E5A44A4|nr:enoyl-CoA hydratase/isomerase family protein [Paraneptunicella aestuarii]UAA40265.1 enoyl-CoA hydratase/isomerase family protein [Paraneptunicella aestuarii]